MSTFFLISTDIQYFKQATDIPLFNKTAQIKALDNEIKTIKICPTEKEIIDNLTDDTICFLDFNPPHDKFKDILIIKDLPLIQSLLTTQEIKYDIDLRSSLLQKLQLEVIHTTRDFSNLAGAEEMKHFFKQVHEAYDKQKVEKITVFLLGIPGAGKTYLAECVAGEFGYLLVKLDLSLIMHMDNPIRKLHQFFRYVETLASQGEYVVALLDEIAQMLNGDGTLQNQFKGQLLTILEDLNSPRGYQVGKSMFIATENNIRLIMDTTPQFMRRWLESFFINFPKEDEAKDMFRMYLKKYDVKLDETNSTIQIDRLYREISKYWRDSKIEVNLSENRFIYAPSEIAKFCSKLSIYSEGSIEITNELIRKICKITPAQQEMLRKGITAMINDAGKGFIEI